MTQDEVIDMARRSGLTKFVGNYDQSFALEAFAKLVAQHERERIKQANAPEIERVNAHIKQLEDAVLAEREACAKFFDDNDTNMFWGSQAASHIRARGQA